MFFDQVPPDTSAYMLAGYTIFFVVTAIYVASLFIRTRNLDRDLETLRSVQEEQRAAPEVPAAAAKPAAAAARTRKAAPARTARTKTKTKTTKTKQASRKSVKKR